MVIVWACDAITNFVSLISCPQIVHCISLSRFSVIYSYHEFAADVLLRWRHNNIRTQLPRTSVMGHKRPNFKQPWKREDFVNHDNFFAKVIRKIRRFYLAKNILGGSLHFNKPFNKNKHNKFFIMLERKSVNFHSNTRHSSHYKSECNLYCEILLSIRGLPVW